MASSVTKPTFITRDSLLRGDAYGIHVLGESIDGYKKVNCVIEYKKAVKYEDFSVQTEVLPEKCVAKVKIPQGATVVRPYTEDIDGDKSISNKLRTDTYEVLDFYSIDYQPNVIEKKIIGASSMHSPAHYPYEKDKRYTEKLDQNVNKQCTTGLHFFLTKNEAFAYSG